MPNPSTAAPPKRTRHPPPCQAFLMMHPHHGIIDFQKELNHIAAMASSTPADHDDQYDQVLRQLIAQGAELATRLCQQAAANQATDPSQAYERICETIRRNILLARHIAAGPPTPRPIRTRTRARARAQLIRGVEDAIERQAHKTDAPALRRELLERLERPELERDLEDRPIAELIEEISRDLGVAVQGRSYVWKRRTPNDIAELQAKAETPSETAGPLPPLRESARGEGSSPRPRPPPETGPPTPG